MDKEKVGAFIRERRREQNLTQKELADKLHITDKAVSKWERGISFPDITILEKLSELLEVSLFELMCGEKAAQKETDKYQIEVVLTETVQEAHRKTSSQKRKFRTILCAVMLMFAGVLMFLYFAREIINEKLDTWAENADMPYHDCKFSVSYVPQAWEEIEGFYIYKTEAEQEHYYLYHVCSIGKDRQEKELFMLEEYGMNLDRAPKLRADEKYLYILFEGLDNEDLEERLYKGEVQADIQGFLPVLYRYEMMTGMVEKVKIEKENVSLLVDAFTWQGETVYLESRYKGLIGGLNLGFYFEDGYYLSDFGRGELRLTGEGGMKTTGCLMGDEYYICGKEGIYQFNLMTKEVKLIVPMDLRDCTRVEIQSLTVEGRKFWGMIYTQIAENCHTNIMSLDENWKILEQMELPYEVSGLEWGESSAMISSVLKEQLAMSFIDFKDFSYRDLTELVNISVRQQLLEDLSESHRRDQWEQEENQWVYLRQSKEYLFVGTDVFFREK